MELWNKFKNFIKNNKKPIGCVLIGIGTGGLIANWISLSKRQDRNEPTVVYKYVSNDDVDDDENRVFGTRMIDLICSQETNIKEENFWDERRREDWNAVNEVAKKLTHLEDAEFYIIEGINPDINPFYEEYLVHHFRGGRPSYPDELVDDMTVIMDES